MIFYLAAIRKNMIGEVLSFNARHIEWYRRNIVYGKGEYTIIIRGFAIVEPENGGEEHYFMSKDTPYIIWREDDGRVNQCFYMKLDHRSPSECQGGDLSPEQAWAAVAVKIREEGSPLWPAGGLRLKRRMVALISTEALRRAGERRCNPPADNTFCGDGTTVANTEEIP